MDLSAIVLVLMALAAVLIWPLAAYRDWTRSGARAAHLERLARIKGAGYRLDALEDRVARDLLVRAAPIIAQGVSRLRAYCLVQRVALQVRVGLAADYAAGRVAELSDEEARLRGRAAFDEEVALLGMARD